MHGSLIRLFLVDDNPNGLRTVEISNMTIYTTIFPRTKLKDFLSREESKKAGCYILLGNNLEDPDRMEVYVGEGDPVDSRLKNHAYGVKQKDFWDKAIVFTSKDDYITKTQIQYLEAEIYKLIREADKAMLDNTQVPSSSNLSEVDTAEMNHFLDAVKLILSSIGIDMLEPKRLEPAIETPKETEIIYQFNINGAEANMKVKEEKYIVLQGSTAVKKNRPSINSAIKNMRASLINSGVLQEDNKDLYKFTDDYIFNSPSYAAAAIAGGTENGRKQWKHQGKSLNEMELKELE